MAIQTRSVCFPPVCLLNSIFERSQISSGMISHMAQWQQIAARRNCHHRRRIAGVNFQRSAEDAQRIRVGVHLHRQVRQRKDPSLPMHPELPMLRRLPDQPFTPMPSVQPEQPSPRRRRQPYRKPILPGFAPTPGQQPGVPLPHSASRRPVMGCRGGLIYHGQPYA